MKSVAVASNRYELYESNDMAFKRSMKALDMFESLEKILLVEQHYVTSRNPYLEPGYPDGKDSNGNLWVYLECEAPDALGYGLAAYTTVASKYATPIRQYMMTTGTWGRDFFQKQAQELQRKLKKEQNWFSGPIVTVHDNVVVNI